MITDINYYKKVGKRILILIFTLIIIYITYKLFLFYIPFLIAFVISLFIEPVIKKIMKITNFTRKTSAIFTLIMVFGIVIGLLVWGIASLITETNFILENLNNTVENIGNKISNFVTNFSIDNIHVPNKIKEIILDSFQNLISMGSDIAKRILTGILNLITDIPKTFICIGITIIATYFVCADKMYILDQLEHHLPRKWVNKFGIKLRKVITSLGNYLKAEGILIFISFILILIGLMIFNFLDMNVKYPLIIALLISFVDALPILGAGTIIIPWAVISASYGDITLAVALIILYIIVVVIKQLIEPRIVSNHIGIHPIFTLISMYTAFKFIGIVGLFIGPIFLIILKNVFETMIDNGVVKTILDRK